MLELCSLSLEVVLPGNSPMLCLLPLRSHQVRPQRARPHLAPRASRLAGARLRACALQTSRRPRCHAHARPPAGRLPLPALVAAARGARPVAAGRTGGPGADAVGAGAGARGCRGGAGGAQLCGLPLRPIRPGCKLCSLSLELLPVGAGARGCRAGAGGAQRGRGARAVRGRCPCPCEAAHHRWRRVCGRPSPCARRRVALIQPPKGKCSDPAL